MGMLSLYLVAAAKLVFSQTVLFGKLEEETSRHAGRQDGRGGRGGARRLFPFPLLRVC